MARIGIPSLALICCLSLILTTNFSVAFDNNNEDKNQTNVVKEENLRKPDIDENESQRAIDLYETALLLLSKSKTNAKKAYSLLEESAKLNHRKAKELVAKSHLFAIHLPFDAKKAHKYFESLPINQSSESHLFLGFIYSMGLGVKASQQKSLLHYTLAANLDNSLAKMAIAFRYTHGIGVRKSCIKALDLYHSVATSVVENADVFGGEVLKTYHLWDQKEELKQNYDNIDSDLFNYYQFLAKRNDIKAQVSLGQLYYFGVNGVQRDRSRALTYFQKAAKSGDGNALAFLSKFYLEGSHSIQQNYTKALELLKESVKKGSAVGLTELGLMYRNGKGVELNFETAFRLFAESARHGWVEGLLHLGVMYMNGLGVARDYRMAFKYLTLALQSKHLLVFYNLGQLYATGNGIDKSCATAVEYFKTVGERGVWSEWLTEANIDYKKQKVFQAFMKFAFLSELGYELSQSNVAFLLENHEFQQLFICHRKRLTLALRYWTRSASQGMSYSRIKVGDYHYYGLGTPVNYRMAIYHYRKASANRYSAQALFNLGYLHEKGLGVKRNFGMALVYYEMAAQLDSEARIPVFLAKLKMKAIQTIVNYFDLSKYFGNKWDLVLILILSIVLCFAIYVKLS